MMEVSSQRRRRSIIRQVFAGFVALIALVALAGGVAFWGMQESRRDLQRAEQSFRQLETIHAIEGAFSRYLLVELSRRLDGNGDPSESAEAGAVRGTLLVYRRQIAEEITLATSEEERARERAGMIRASALTDLFETIEGQSLLDRQRGEIFGSTAAAQHFLGNIVADRDIAFRAVIGEVEQDERAEAASAFAGLDETRARLIEMGILLAVLLLVAVLVMLVLLQRRLTRPILSLSSAAAAFGAGDMKTKAPADLPGEFADLGRQFNSMAERIAGEQHRLQAQVRTRTEELEQANRELTSIDSARRRFFANISHELRTPVTVLLGEAQIAARARTAEAMREALERIAASGGFLKRRLDDLMKLARSEDGQLRLTLTATDLSATVRAAVSAAEGYARANEITLAAEIADDVSVTGDGESLRQALLALIDNAIKFTPPDGRVDVSLAREDSQTGGNAVLIVRDTGPGFDGDPEQLFDRYAQETAGRAAGGTGLGLAIAKWIVDQHDGAISVNNHKAGGAAFRIELPLNPASQGGA